MNNVIGAAMSQIEIVDYRPVWAEEFKWIAAALKQALGHLAVAIDHIGSTSVPGLAAKDVIDIQVSVKALDNPKIENALSEAGYRYRADITRDNLIGYNEDDLNMQKMYFREPQGQRKIHIHIREVGRVNQVYALLFRDFLRDNAIVSQAYEKIKRELALRFPNDEIAYYAIKDPYMDTIFSVACMNKQVNQV
ncbi:GrpB family protein [Pseudoalteromonas luteoviolacea]|uniref:GrpB family protein n=1 Tax=Pseudoalteromonas luteoviolacea TaxID=43657 RepID=UPI001B381CE4|nr:GrpB family protein [Pseudoalteromonas luteoviolacea]MBQ4838035.1 GrpB family protein [Pseudoalteromonas luteoviolacea]